MRVMVALLICAGITLAGCAQNAVVRPETLRAALSESETKSESKEQGADARADRMLIWRAYLTIEVWNVTEEVGRVVAIAEQWSGYVEQKSDSGQATASLRLRIPVANFKKAVGDIESLGNVSYRNVVGEDVTEQYVDVEARLKNKIELRDRLRQLLQKAADVKDVISIETELNRVQSDIDSMEAKIRVLKGQVEFATIEVTLHRKVILGPIGYVLKGLWWGIEKLFVIRE